MKGIMRQTAAGQRRNEKIPPSVGDGRAVVLSASRSSGAPTEHPMFPDVWVGFAHRLQPAEAVRTRWEMEMEEGKVTVELGSGCLGDGAWVRPQSE